jgi:hypothetical protein
VIRASELKARIMRYERARSNAATARHGIEMSSPALIPSDFSCPLLKE